MWRLLSGILLGWGLGANDSANIFGTAVSSRMVKYSTAIILTAIFVMFGAILQGEEGMNTLKGLTAQNQMTAFITSLAAAITVIIMTVLKLPISTSQAVVGAIIGLGIMQKDVNASGLTKVVTAWIGTPIGGFLFTIILYHLIYQLFKWIRPTIFQSDIFIKIGLLVAGCYGAYALGANNVANVTGVYVAGGILTPSQATLIGGISIAIGTLTFSREVMFTVGKSIVKLDAFSALITVVAHSITVHIYAVIGVPVSTSQAIIGAILAIGFIKGVQTINFTLLLRIVSAWFMTPVIGLLLSMFLYFIMHLQYVS